MILAVTASTTVLVMVMVDPVTNVGAVHPTSMVNFFQFVDVRATPLKVYANQTFYTGRCYAEST
jgi:hypothetical protein